MVRYIDDSKHQQHGNTALLAVIKLRWKPHFSKAYLMFWV